MAKGPPSPQGHGTRACYVLGCRRAECKAANATYMRGWRSAWGSDGYPYNAALRLRPVEARVRRRAPNGTRALAEPEA
jgi:hypothetical protein